VAGVDSAAQGLAPAPAGGWQPAGGDGGVRLYWLADRGDRAAFGVAGSDLVGLLKAAWGDLAGRSERSVLKAALDAGVVLVDGRHPGRWSQLVKVAGKARRVPRWLLDRVDRLTDDARAQLLGRLCDAGVAGRTLSHDELLAVERWLVAAERASGPPAPAPPAPAGAGVPPVPACTMSRKDVRSWPRCARSDSRAGPRPMRHSRKRSGAARLAAMQRFVSAMGTPLA
jgi:hypothetical protein